MRRRTLSGPFRVELAATLRLAAPLALANLLQMAVYASDVIFVAWLGEAALAAAALAVAIFALTIWGLTGLVGAMAPLVAAELGRRRHAVREVRRTLRMALWLAVASGAAAAGVCLAGGPIMRLTGQDPALIAAAAGFLRILALATLPLLAGNVLRIFVATMGRPLYATVITALAIVVNAAGNWLFIFGHLGVPALGLNGSAIATVATTIMTLAAYLVAIRCDRRLRRSRLFGRWWHADWPRLRDIARLGAPICLTVVAEAGLFSSAAFLMGRFGPAELAAHSLALQIASFFFQVPFGVAQAATIRVGYHFGEGSAVAIAAAGRAALAVGFGFSALSACVMLLAPRLILSAYVDVAAPANAPLVALAVDYLAVAAAFQLFDGTQTVLQGVLRGLQDTRAPMVIAVGGYWLGGFCTAVALGFGTGLRGTGVWIGFAVGLGLVAALLLERWRRRARRELDRGRDDREFAAATG